MHQQNKSGAERKKCLYVAFF